VGQHCPENSERSKNHFAKIEKTKIGWLAQKLTLNNMHMSTKYAFLSVIISSRFLSVLARSSMTETRSRQKSRVAIEHDESKLLWVEGQYVAVYDGIGFFV
jgi:hypothetical protein